MRLKNLILLAASIFFYAWGEQLFFVVMLASIVINWVFGLLLSGFREKRAAQLIVAAAVIVNIGLLGFYKYSGFVVAQIDLLIAPLGLAPIVFEAPHLPLGISFFTFHALSYVIDIYRRECEAQKNPIDFALYISFFPQLIAGPIIRYHDICDQLSKRRVTFDLAVSGLERFIAGFGKKILLANPLGEVADKIFALPTDQMGTSTAWLGIICYALQIFLDFSAYSDMAIGLARIFGFEFLENFDYPYRARSIQEFWRRWHISLSNWFRDYLYIPLGGNRVAEWRVWLNLTIIFLVCGFWHGAAWTFVIWGALHGVFLVLERAGLGALLKRLPSAVQHLYTLVVVLIAWVFFRANDLGGALAYLHAMVSPGPADGIDDARAHVDTLVAICLVLGALVSSGAFTRLTADWINRARQSRGVVAASIDTLRIGDEGRGILAVRLVVLVTITLLALGRLAVGTYNPFIYFRF